MTPAAQEVLSLAASEIRAIAARAEDLGRSLRSLADSVVAGDVVAFADTITEWQKAPPTMDLGLATQLVAAVRDRDPDYWAAEKERGDMAAVAKIDANQLELYAAAHSMVCQKAGCGVMRAINERLRQGKAGPS